MVVKDGLYGNVRLSGCGTAHFHIQLMYSKFSHGSEGNINQSLRLFLLMYSMYSHGSESKYAIAPLVLLVRENTIL